MNDDTWTVFGDEPRVFKFVLPCSNVSNQLGSLIASRKDYELEKASDSQQRGHNGERSRVVRYVPRRHFRYTFLVSLCCFGVLGALFVWWDRQ